MKNVTVSLDEDTYQRARKVAFARSTSVSALVREALRKLGSSETEFERLKKEEQALREQIKAFRASDRLSRDEVHERGA